MQTADQNASAKITPLRNPSALHLRYLPCAAEFRRPPRTHAAGVSPATARMPPLPPLGRGARAHVHPLALRSSQPLPGNGLVLQSLGRLPSASGYILRTALTQTFNLHSSLSVGDN